MDPLSITASSVAVLTICTQVTHILTKWISSIKNVDNMLWMLDSEVVSLSAMLGSITETFQRPALVAIIESDHDARLWSSTAGILKSCRSSMRRLRTLLTDLDSTMESATVFKKAFKQFWLGQKTDDITALQREIQFHNALLQMNLQCAGM